MTNKAIEYLDHTADIGIVVSAQSLEEIFALAAKGMMGAIIPTGRIEEKVTRPVTVTAGDLEELLVNWLSELNFLLQTEQFLTASVKEISIRQNELAATIAGETIDPEKHDVELEIKAVTFHKLFVKQSKTGWQARVIFDI